MKKLLVISTFLIATSSFAVENINIYGKIGIDVHSRFTDTSELDEDGFETGAGFPKKGKIGYGLFLEATKNLSPNFELGVGIGYIERKGTNTSSLSGIDTTISGEITQTKKTYDYYKAERYDSFPLYLTAKYNFNTNSNLKPYVKADLGYSFNRIKSSMNVSQREYDDNSVLIAEDNYKVGLKVKNGLYTAIGVGIEYNNFLAELAYVHTSAKLKTTYTGSDFPTGSETYTFKNKNNAVRILLGYKFNF